MKLSRKGSLTRGFTLVEMMTSVFILGLMLLLIGYEFDHTISHLLHTQSKVDVESNARTTMVKIVNGLKAATPDVQVAPFQVIFRPVTATPVASLQYLRVHQGSLDDITSIQFKGGVPAPPFDLVTVQCKTGCSPTTPDELEETVADDLSPNTILSRRTLGHDVTGFSVANNGGPDFGELTITLTVAHPWDAKTAQYSTARCSPTCQYTVATEVWVGGAKAND